MYINYFNNVHNLSISGVTPEVKTCFEQYGWPGNIRELRNVIEHSFIIESSDTINIGALPDILKKGRNIQEIDESSNQIESVIDLADIQESVLNDNDLRNEENQDYKFSFASTKKGEDVIMDFQLAKDLFEKEFIFQALKVNKGKINQTALKANIPKKTLLRKIEKYELNPKDFY